MFDLADGLIGANLDPGSAVFELLPPRWADDLMKHQIDVEPVQ